MSIGPTMPSKLFVISEGFTEIECNPGNTECQVSIFADTNASSGNFVIYAKQGIGSAYVSILDCDQNQAAIDATSISSSGGDGTGQVVQFWGDVSHVKVVADSISGLSEATVMVSQR